jgi:hypothetical protein
MRKLLLACLLFIGGCVRYSGFEIKTFKDEPKFKDYYFCVYFEVVTDQSQPQKNSGTLFRVAEDK